MRRILYQLKNFKFDILTTFSTTILAVIAYMFWQKQLTVLLSTILFVVIFLIVVIYLQVKDKDFYFISLTRREDKDDWIGSGIFEYVKVASCFQITNTDPGGYIFSKCLTWSDYKYEFGFKIVNECLGAIVRAVNLSNLGMLQITKSGIRAHICINGGWFFWEAKDTGLAFGEALSLDKWYVCQIFCEKQDITIKIYEEKELIFDRQWKIPGGKIEFSFPKNEHDKNPIKIPSPINLEYGSVGFRNSGNEKALIKNVLVEKM